MLGAPRPQSSRSESSGGEHEAGRAGFAAIHPPGLRSTPTIEIRLPLEGSPKVDLSSCGEGDGERLLVWLRANPRKLGLVAEAIEQGTEAEALSGR